MKIIKEFKNFNPHPENQFPYLDDVESNNVDLDREEMEEPLNVVSGFEDDELEDMSDDELERMYAALEKDVELRNEGFIKSFENFSMSESREDLIEILTSNSNFEREELDEMTDTELEDLYHSLEIEDWSDELEREGSGGENWIGGPYSYEGCGCCPVCTGEKDCECGCPECNYPEELEELEESKKSGVTASLKKKSKASGIPVGILRKVFSKGMQAWNAGHRPGVAQHQWGMGRVNSFITGAGGARKADADLWAKAKAAKARKRKKRK